MDFRFSTDLDSVPTSRSMSERARPCCTLPAPYWPRTLLILHLTRRRPHRDNLLSSQCSICLTPRPHRRVRASCDCRHALAQTQKWRMILSETRHRLFGIMILAKGFGERLQSKPCPERSRLDRGDNILGEADLAE